MNFCLQQLKIEANELLKISHRHLERVCTLSGVRISAVFLILMNIIQLIYYRATATECMESLITTCHMLQRHF
jgi:hypothetical protein